MAKRWVVAGNLNVARAAYAGCLLQNGKVLVTGGEPDVAATSVLSSCELYDSTTDTWTLTGSLSVARNFHQCVLLQNGKVLVVGGFSNYTSQIGTSVCELYDPVAGTWSTTGSLPTGKFQGGLWLLLNGKVLHAGGSVDGNANASVADAYLYDPATGLWTVTGSLNTSRHVSATSYLPNGNPIMVSGKHDAIGTQTAEVYNVGSGTWSYTTGAPVFAGEVDGGNNAVVLQDGRTLFAGWAAVGGSRTPCQIYDPVSDSFTSAGSLALGRSELNLFLLGDGRALAAGGQINVAPENSVTNSEIYDPVSNTWFPAAYLNEPRGTGTLTSGILLSDGTPLWAGGSDNVTLVFNSSEIYKEVTTPMGITQIQAAEHGQSGSITNVVTIAPSTAGSLIVVQFACNTAKSVASVSDGTNTYQLATGTKGNTGNLGTEIWYALNVSAGITSVTVTLTATGNSMVSVEEYSGIKSSAAFDTGANQNNSGPILSPSITPSAAGELLVASAVCDDFFITGVSSPWTTSDHETSVDGFATGYYVNAPLSPQQAPFVPSTSTTSGHSSAASFLATPTGPSADQKASMFLVF